MLLITSEYATGLIRTSLAAVPRRLPVLWGKAALLAAATVAVSLPAGFAAFLGRQSILGRQHLSVSSAAGVARAVIGSALYLAVAGLIGLGLGALLRSTAGGIAALFGLLFALQIVAGFLPGSWSDDVGKYLPSTAGLAVTSVPARTPHRCRPGSDSACSACTPSCSWSCRPSGCGAATPSRAGADA